MKPMLLDIDYKFRDDLSADNEPVFLEIVSDTPWKGVIYRYDVVSFSENPLNTNPKIIFSYLIKEVPAGLTEAELRADPAWETYVGNILNSLILDSVDAAEAEEVSEDE